MQFVFGFFDSPRDESSNGKFLVNFWNLIDDVRETWKMPSYIDAIFNERVAWTFTERI